VEAVAAVAVVALVPMVGATLLARVKQDQALLPIRELVEVALEARSGILRDPMGARVDLDIFESAIADHKRLSREVTERVRSPQGG
jgi:hypothetical protein